MGSASWLRSFKALQRTLPEVGEDSEAGNAIVEALGKAPETEESPLLLKQEAVNAPKEEKIAKKIPKAAEKPQTAKGQVGGSVKARKTQKRKKTTPKGSRKVRKHKNKEKDEKTPGPTEVKNKVDMEKSSTEGFEAGPRCHETWEQFRKRRIRENKEIKRREAEEAANDTDSYRRPRLSFGLCM